MYSKSLAFAELEKYNSLKEKISPIEQRVFERAHDIVRCLEENLIDEINGLVIRSVTFTEDKAGVGFTPGNKSVDSIYGQSYPKYWFTLTPEDLDTQLIIERDRRYLDGEKAERAQQRRLYFQLKEEFESGELDE